jgi:hypothetical protein
MNFVSCRAWQLKWRFVIPLLGCILLAAALLAKQQSRVIASERFKNWSLIKYGVYSANLKRGVCGLGDGGIDSASNYCFLFWTHEAQ